MFFQGQSQLTRKIGQFLCRTTYFCWPTKVVDDLYFVWHQLVSLACFTQLLPRDASAERGNATV